MRLSREKEPHTVWAYARLGFRVYRVWGSNLGYWAPLPESPGCKEHAVSLARGGLRMGV